MSTFVQISTNHLPVPSRSEQAVRTITQIREMQDPKANILCTSHASDVKKSLSDNFEILRMEIEKEIDPIAPELNGCAFVNSLDELSRANKEYEGHLIFLDNVRKTVAEETKPPENSSGSALWRYFSPFDKVNNALSCCHRDHLSLRIFTDGCYCSDTFVNELQTVTELYSSSDDNDVKIWGVAGAKLDKLDSIYLTEEETTSW
jgi:3-phosphoglycerate kinase